MSQPSSPSLLFSLAFSTKLCAAFDRFASNCAHTSRGSYAFYWLFHTAAPCCGPNEVESSITLLYHPLVLARAFAIAITAIAGLVTLPQSKSLRGSRVSDVKKHLNNARRQMGTLDGPGRV
ncbi:hypothetical protein EDB87DRAFT_1575215 [Lactarius vividus]|nr:hypothetical protein EDB87DRAFT_1575215 [Lactarius vividus]